MVEFGERLKKLRKRDGLTQKQLGEKIGVTKSMISYYELRERVPGPATLSKIADVFHVSVDYLMNMDNGSTIDIEGLSAHDAEVIRRMVAVMRKLNEESSSSDWQ